MISLHRQTAQQLLLFEVLQERGDLEHISALDIQQTFRQMQKGYTGELRADREWQDMQLQYRHYLLHDFQAKNELQYTHQIDTLLLTTRFAIVVELKDYGGTIVFDDEAGEVQQIWSDGQVKYYDHPMHQVLRHVQFIQKELQKIKMPLPVLPVVVLTDLKSRLIQPSKRVKTIKLPQLRFWIEHVVKNYQPVITEEQINLANEYLLSRVERVPLRRHYPQMPLLKGVVCKACRLQMVHERKGFRCTNCNQKTTNGIYEALHAYRLLESEWITNRDFRAYMGIESIQTANKMLKRLGLEQRGGNKNRQYKIPANIRGENRG